MNKFLYLIILLTTQTLFPRHMTSLFFIESSFHMNLAAMKNISEMIEGSKLQKNDDISFLVQWHAQGDAAWRFEITQGTLQHIAFVKSGKHIGNDIVAAMKWATSMYPADHYALMLSGHGYGILTPEWHEALGRWFLQKDFYLSENMCHQNHRSVMLCKTTTEKKIRHTCLDNDAMIKTFNRIKHECCNGKKLDLLAFDACSMAMLEIGYQLKDSVALLIASQECIPLAGYNYKDFIKALVTQKLSPRDCAQTLVKTYADRYKKSSYSHRYTLSALDLSFANSVKENLDHVAQLILACVKDDEKRIKKIIFSLRLNEITPFCVSSSYADLYQVYETLEAWFCSYSIKAQKKELVEKLLQTLREGKKNMQNMILCNKNTMRFEHSHGICVYFPLSHIEKSYRKTLFVQNSNWYTFLEWLTRD